MIYLEIHGRLGNQLFQYAFARRLSLLYKQQMTISFSEFLEESKHMHQDGWENALQYLRVKSFEEYKGHMYDEIKISKHIKFLIFLRKNLVRLYRNKNFHKMARYETFISQVFFKFGIFFLNNGFVNYQNIYCRDYFLKGFYENPCFFDAIKETLVDELKPKSIQNKDVLNLLKTINSTQSICLSIRSFNEIKHNKKQYNLYNVCSKDYYYKAIKYMNHRVKDPIYFIFSDDIPWVKNNYDFSELNVYYQCKNFKEWEIFYLMSSCKNFIISNSTFCWWAQYLNTNNEKIVIGPQKWYNNKFESPLIQREWIRL